MSAEDYHRVTRLRLLLEKHCQRVEELLADELASLIQNCIEGGSPIGIRGRGNYFDFVWGWTSAGRTYQIEPG